MIQRTFKKAFFALIIGLNITTIFAGTAFSEEKSIYAYGYNYINLSYIVTDSSYGASAYTVICNEKLEHIPTGYMSAQARLFSDEGQLIKASKFEYNSDPVWSVQSSSGWYTERGIYYSYGITKVSTLS